MPCHAHSPPPKQEMATGIDPPAQGFPAFPSRPIFPTQMRLDAIVAPKLICIILQSALVDEEGPGEVWETQTPFEETETYSHGFQKPGRIQMKFGGTEK